MQQNREEIIRRIFEHSEAMKRGMYGHMQAYFHNLPITRSQVEVLSAIAYLQPVSSKKIAQRLYLTPGAVSQSVETLDSQDYLVREADPTDRRVQYLRLSKKGDKLLQDIEKRRRDMMEQVLQNLTLEELMVWLKVQTKLGEQLHTTHVKTNKED